MSLFYKETTCKSSTLEGLLYTPDLEKCKKGTLSDQPRPLCITSTVLLCHWGQKVLKDMTSLGTDCEMHAIWQQGYIEDLAAEDFVARKARTIALNKAQGSCHRKSNNHPYSQVWKSPGDSLPKLYCVA